MGILWVFFGDYVGILWGFFKIHQNFLGILKREFCVSCVFVCLCDEEVLRILKLIKEVSNSTSHQVIAKYTPQKQTE